MIMSYVAPHPVIVPIRDNKDYMRVLLYSHCTTITVRGSTSLGLCDREAWV